MNISTIIRGKYTEALKGLEYEGTPIPIFDETVNPASAIPIINGAECYVVFQNQQERMAGIQNFCKIRIQADITVRVVTKYGLTGGKKLSEDIADIIDSRIRSYRGNNIGVERVDLIQRSTVEQGKENTAYQKILIYTNTLNV